MHDESTGCRRRYVNPINEGPHHGRRHRRTGSVRAGKHPDGTSVNPEFWWEAFTKAAEQAGGLDDVAALAVGGQQHGMVILDKQGNVIRDAMLWNDTSSAPQAAALIDKLGAAPAEGDEPDDVTARGKQRWVKAVGSSPVASYTLTKVAWVAENEPENARRLPPSVCRTIG